MAESRLKNWLRRYLPPQVLHVALRLLGRATRFKGPMETWEEASSLSVGYSKNSILEKVLAASLKVKDGDAAYERDSVLFDKIEYSWPALTGLLWAAARHGGRLNVLDFGGALGSSYFQNRFFIDRLEHVRWGVVEQEHFVECGQTHMQDARLSFYSSIDDCVNKAKPNVILLSGVLQYIEAPEDLLTKLVAIKADCLILDRTIVNSSLSSSVYVQYVPKQIYEASYPCWSLSESTIIALIEQYHYKCATDFYSLAFPALGSINSEYKGYIFMRSV
ncbi:FIG00762746: hypothetical protein [Olavius algarvensis associated proteobacterium Delta 3]|nr:FIG00762746: hypothetical protein [Olavius algarvensis associated proteobacterium Delta 3]CAB5101237.1 FIG00762746: hypothetical protein [Olavius algarvensis associated proteobacterium Delta 3]